MNKLIVIIILIITIINVSKTSAQSNFSSAIIQIGVVVENLEKSVDFYTNVLGMVETSSFSINKEFSKSSGLSNGVPFDVVTLKLEDSPNATQWKLMSFGKKAAHKKPDFIQDDNGVQYITVNVKSLNPFIERIKKNNVKFLGETPVSGGGDGNHFVMIQDPDGTFIEIIGPMK